ncbi:uncharacterized protein M421DRAFT_3865 [Didymella exigua CBS 183.55]|uniref:Uncharacterized protein n=1 Tax=Didymella exigua CBS 183.55 TaxID=1150837 RepID=A0A6A5RRY8_9PLEO|nr:uncharacterized protein M421DRAFT_3865 [Didymella exigua CBS 183.55]KAF1930110.1 hypothetical protein M421DRAFT_3865 [Didymella exigua CBS 183.55]
MASRPASSSSSDSLYAPPSPPNLRRVAQVAPVSHYTSLHDVPPLSLNGAIDPTAHRGMPTSTKISPTIVRPPPSSHCYQRPAGLTCPLPEPVHRDILRVVNRYPPPLSASSSTLIDGHSRIHLKGKPTRGKIDFTDPFAEKKYEQPKTDFQAPMSEKRKLNADLCDVARRLETAFGAEKCQQNRGLTPTVETSWCNKHYNYDTCIATAEKRDGFKCLSPLTPAVSDFPPPGRVWAGTIRLPNCHSCKNNWSIRHLHGIEEERVHQESRKRQAEEQKKEQERQRLRAEEERLRRETQTTRFWPDRSAVKSPLIVRSPTTTWVEDVRAVRPDLSMPTPRKTEPKAAPPSAMAFAQAAANIASPKADPEVEPKFATPSGDRATASAAAFAQPSQLASQKTALLPRNLLPPPTQTAHKEKERLRLRMHSRMKLLAVQQQADEDAQWDNVDLSDDEEWDKVAADEGADWEVLEK